MKRLFFFTLALGFNLAFTQPVRSAEKPQFGPLQTLELKPNSAATRGLSVYGFLRWKYFLAEVPVGEMPSLVGTSWEGPSRYDGFIRWHFGPKGDLNYENEGGEWHNGSWMQRGEAVYIEANGRYAEHIAVLRDGVLVGNGRNIGGVSDWQWSVRPMKKADAEK